MRILQIVTKRQYRGAEVFAALLTGDLAARGHDVTFVGVYSPPADPLKAPGASALDLNVKPGQPVRAIFRMCQLILEQRPDVIQCNGSDTLKYTCLAVKLIRRPPPLVYRNISMISHWINTPAKKWFYRWLFSGVKMVVSVSEASRTDFIRLIKKNTADVVTIKNVITIKRGVDLPTGFDRSGARKAVEAMFAKLGERALLLHVGAMTGEKNHRGLLRIFKEVVDANPHVCLCLLGHGPERPLLEQQVAQLGLSDCVIFGGYHSDPSPFYLAADLLLLPSHIEGIPGVVLEAAAFQTPAVAYDVGGMAEAIVQGATGVLVAHGAEHDFADEVVRLLRSETKRTQMGAAAREYVEQHYNREVTVKQFEKLYTSLSK